MVPSQDARTAAASIALHAATAATHAGCIAVYIADWRRFLWNEDYPPVPNKYFETYIHTRLRMRMDSQSQSHALSRGGCVLQRSCLSSLAAGQTGGGLRLPIKLNYV